MPGSVFQRNDAYYLVTLQGVLMVKRVGWLSLLVLCTASHHAAFAAEASPSDSDIFPVKRVEPRISQNALMNGVSGWVVVEGTVGPDGNVVEARVTRARPKGWFEREALIAVRQWTFKPRIQGGVAVSRSFSQRFIFEVPNQKRHRKLREFVRRDRPAALQFTQRLVAACSSQYQHADDALNRTLQRLAFLMPNESLVLHDDEFVAASILNSVGSCLFSSWEHLHDPAVLALAAEFAALDDEAAEGVPQALRRLAQLRGADAELSAEDRLATYPGRAWALHRMVDALEYAVDDAIARRAEPVAMLEATETTLEAARKAWHPKLPVRALRLLDDALAARPPPPDRALLLLAKGRFLMLADKLAEAMSALELLSDDLEAPFNARDMARLLCVGLATRLDDVAAFDRNVMALAEQLGVSDRLKL